MINDDQILGTRTMAPDHHHVDAYEMKTGDRRRRHGGRCAAAGRQARQGAAARRGSGQRNVISQAHQLNYERRRREDDER